MPVIKLGILGCGSFAQRRILPAAKALPDLYEVTCIQKRDLAEAQKVAASFGIPHAVSTREELFAHADVIFITSINERHEEDALACAKAGKPTICEKPLALTYAQAQRLVVDFERRQIPFFVGHSLRFKPAIRTAKELLPRIGDLQHIHIHYSIPVPKDSWKYRKECGGGVLQDLGVHLIDFIHFMAGSPITSVTAKGTVNGVDTTVHADCLIGSLPASFSCSFNGPESSGFEIRGTKGTLTGTDCLRQMVEQPDTLLLNGEPISLAKVNIYEEELKHIAEVLLAGGPSIIDASIAVPIARVVEAARHSL